MGHGTVGLVRICWSFVYCCRHRWTFVSVISKSMQGQSSLTEVQRAQIVTLCGVGYTERDIAAKLHCSKTAVHNAIVQFNADVQ